MANTITREDVINGESSSMSGADVEKPRRFLKRYRTEVAASLSSIISTTAAFPLDSVKTRMQTYNIYNGFSDCVRKTYNVEGLSGFWRGVTAPIASVTFVRTVSFSTYQKAKYTYSQWIYKNFGIDPLVHINTPGNYPNLATLACFSGAGATAGSVITLVACPFELTKLSAQVSVLMEGKAAAAVGLVGNSSSQPSKKPAPSLGTYRTAKKIVMQRGIAGLYSGFWLHFLRDTCGTAIYFGTYETVKQLMQTYSGSQHTASPLSTVIAGGLCGIASWALIYPIDSAKSIYQRNCLADQKGQPVARTKVQFFRKRMYRGLGVSMGRSCFLNAVFFSVFERLKNRINDLEDID